MGSSPPLRMFLAAYYATLHPALSVRPSITLYFFGQRPRRGRSPVEHRGTFVRHSVHPSIRPSVRSSVRSPQALSGPNSALSGLKLTLSDPKSAPSGLESVRADFRSERT